MLRLRSTRVVVLAACAAAVMFVSTARADWPLAGVRVVGNAWLISTVPDGSGGAFVAWTGRMAGDSMRVLRIDGSGAPAAGWPTRGVALAAPGDQNVPEIATDDGMGGLYVMCRGRVFDWGTFGYSYTHYAWRLAADGTIFAGWPLGVYSYGGFSGPSVLYEKNWRAFAGASGQGFIAYEYADRYDTGDTYYGTRGFRLDPSVAATVGYLGDLMTGPLAISSVCRAGSGLASAIADPYNALLYQWPGSGAHSRLYVGRALEIGVTSLAPAGDMLGWWRLATPADSSQYRVVRYLFPGLTPAAGWPAQGIALTGQPVFEDGAEGAFVRVPDPAGDRLQRVSFAANPPTVLWPGPNMPLLRDGKRAPDGAGGFFQAWLEDPTAGVLRAEHVRSDGQSAPGWWPAGALLSSLARQPMQLVSVGAERALVAWTDAGADSNAIYVQLLADDAPVPVAMSLVSVDASADRVRLVWRSAGDAGTCAVERSSDGASWRQLGMAVREGADGWTFEDGDVTPAASYAYRLVGNDGPLAGSEARVVVPTLAFALRGFTRNPFAGDAVLEFALPDDARAMLEVFDASGRRLASREVGGLGAGVHRVALPELGGLRHGIVFARLSRGGRSLVTRGARLD